MPVSSIDGSRGRILWREFVSLCNRLQVTYYLIRLGELLTAVLPMRVSYALAVTIADAMYVTWRMLRQQIATNVQQVLGEGADAAAVAQITRGVLRNYVKYLVDFVALPSRQREELERLVQIAGLEHLDRALQAGRGVIFVGLHFGSFEVAAAMMALRGYRMNVVVESFQPAKLDVLIQRRRADKGMTLIPLETASATRKLVRALHRNEILGLVIDRPSKDEGVPVEFCGGTTRVPAGAATLALKTGAKLLPGYALRERDDTFTGTILPHIDVETTGDSRHDVQRLTQRIMHSLEESVKQHPEQWYMFREMWPRDLATAQVAAVAEVTC